MRLPSAVSKPMTDRLNQVYFNATWNAPDDSGRANFRLAKASQRLSTGALPVDKSMVGLPTIGEVYAVYKAPIYVFGRFVDFPSNTWISDSEVLTQTRVKITTYTAGGRKVPSGSVYLRYDPLRSQVLVAVGHLYTSKCTGDIYPDLYMTIIFDTTRNTKTTTQTFVVKTPQLRTEAQTAITQALALHGNKSLLTINGWSYDITVSPIVELNDIVEIVTDLDIVNCHNITIDSNITGYHSEKYSEYREVLHIPKATNPTNITITSDTISVVVFDPETGRGVYGHRVSDHAIESITHNDFSIKRSVLDAFQNELGSQSVGVRIIVRFPTEQQTVPDDVNHLADLYTLNDAEILGHLVGTATNSIPEWTATKLEKSAFLDLMYSFKLLTNTQALDQYSSAMGYYSVASALAQTMHYYTYRGGEVSVEKPARLIGYPCRPIVYANGRKVPDGHVHVVNYNDRFELAFSENTYIQIDTRIGMYVCEDLPAVPIVFEPTVSQPTITVSHDDYQLFKEFTYTDPKIGINGTFTKGYREVVHSPGNYTTTINPNGTVTYQVSSIHYGSKLYLIPTTGLVTRTISLDDMIANQRSLIIPLTMSDGSTGTLPLMGSAGLEFYVNGYRLIENIDYTFDPVMGENNDIVQTVVVIANQEYLKLAQTGNYLEVVTHGGLQITADSGYAIDNQLYRDQPPMMWTPSCGRAFVRGRLVEDVVEIGNTLHTQTQVTNGSPYLAEWSIPYGVHKLMYTVDSQYDDTLQTKVDRILRNKPPVYPDIVLIEDQYALYSPYLSTIVKLVSDRDLTLVDFPRNEGFLRQLDKYHLLLERDPILTSGVSLIERDFLTLAAHYVNMTITDPEQLVLLRRLITLVLLPTNLTIDEVLI